MKATFTPKLVQNPAHKPKSGERLLRDAKGQGLALKMTPNGARAFLFVWNAKTGDGRYLEKRIEIEKWSPSANLSDLRATALEMRKRVDNGLPPLATSGLTMQTLFDRYLDHYRPRKRESTIAEDERLWKRDVGSEFGARAPESLTRSEIIAWHHKITVGGGKWTNAKGDVRKRKGSPTQANRAVALLRHVLNFATYDLELLQKNPAARIKFNAEKNREFYLSESQLKTLWQVLETFDDQRAADVVRLAVLTGQRLGEILGARFDEFDLAHATWRIPASRDKAKRGKTIMLPKLALEVVRSRLHARAELKKDDPRRETPFLFTETGEAPLVDLKKPWERIRKKFKMPTLRFHDLRHSFASLLINRGVPLFHVGQALGHTQATTTQRYAHIANDVLQKAAVEVGNVFDTPKTLPQAAE